MAVQWLFGWHFCFGSLFLDGGGLLAIWRDHCHMTNLFLNSTADLEQVGALRHLEELVRPWGPTSWESPVPLYPLPAQKGSGLGV